MPGKRLRWPAWLSTRTCRALVVCTVSALAASCQVESFGIVANESDGAITISIGSGESGRADSSFTSCGLYRPLARDGLPSSLHGGVLLQRANQWKEPASLVFRPSECSYQVELAPKSSLIVFEDGACADSAERFQSNPDIRPTLQLVSIDGAKGSVNRVGWETARLFPRSRKGHCIYTYPDPSLAPP